ncbi:MAG: DHH family phosphoesterase [Candidatus Pacebacteria bacterium]|nr:DHH family phosphoesterase [Candidatus Paceibacterota bacterium]
MLHQIKNLKKAAKRIKQAVKNNERIVIFADADLDGITSAIILEETIQNLFNRVQVLSKGVHAVFFSNREEGGYGLSPEALMDFKGLAPALLIVLDCGISSFEGVKQASQAGFEVMIIDHHEVLGQLPAPALIIDPKQPGDKYAFKKLANVCLVYKLSEEIFNQEIPQTLKSSFLEIGALGAIADMMPEEDCNKRIIQEGSACLNGTFRPGMKAIIDIVKSENDVPRTIFSKIVLALNITGTQGHLTESYILFKEKDPAKAAVLARKLFEESQKRQMRIKEIAQEAISKDNSASPIVFEGNELWEQILTGPVASRVCNKTQKPTFIFKIGKEKCRGSVRMPHGLDGVLALKKCSVFLEVYGGHPPAAGFTCAKEQVGGLKKCLEEHFQGNNFKF